MKHRKHFITLVCLLVGMLVLTSAVYANFDDANGYTSYKNSVKYLLMEADNYTAEVKLTAELDGENMQTVGALYKSEGSRNSLYETSSTMNDTNFKENANEKRENYTYNVGKNGVYYYPKENVYDTISHIESAGGPLFPVNDPTMKKAVRFSELLVDTFIGDLKNNVVLTSKTENTKSYSVNISENQVPEVVNAGLSFLFTANSRAANSNDNYVTYENYEKTFGTWYMEKTGEDYNKVNFDSLSDSERNKTEAIISEFNEKYSDVLDAKGNVGIVFVKEDGSYKYYNAYGNYIAETGNADVNGDIMCYFGDDPYISNAVCNFTLDDRGNLVSNYIEASLTGVAKDGKSHTATMKIDAKIKDYGTTKADVFDKEGKTPRETLNR